ncbi:magnesium transporter [Stieleria sp. JC731]|uniref:magnesium transporter n=2 Tax=Pirellulaceae TaxID=2691357 RepID=UPI001E473B6E|nr:magnesium transporter [Stieleria sp. JC731]MCC9602175.1 magnesium transporter [Stieleria sp. JC731]
MNDMVTESSTETKRPWEEVIRVSQEGTVEELSDLLDTMSVAEQAFVFSHMEDEAEAAVLQRLPAEDAAELIAHLNESEAARMIQLLESPAAASILQEMPVDEQADLIGDLPERDAEAILLEMPQQDAENVRELTAYPDNVAGGMMVVEMLRFRSDMTVAEAIEEINRGAELYTDLDVRYAYVCDDNGRLVGVLPMQNLLFVKRQRKLGDIMIQNPLSVLTTATLEELAEFFESHVYLGVPVVDPDGVLKGVLHREAVQYEEVRAAENDYLKSQGIVGGEELRTMPVWLRSKRRLSWLSINILLNLGAAAVIAYFQETLESVIALAVFLPIISDMSGCSGNQAVAVSMRELSLGIVRPNEFFRVWWKEVTVGLINGSVLGALIAIVAVVFDGNPYLGAVVGTALCVNTLVAVSIGGVVPLLLKRFGFDPAVASGPLLTTVTDMCGFFLVLGLATMLLSKLV